jgi:hypothetical protein
MTGQSTGELGRYGFGPALRLVFSPLLVNSPRKTPPEKSPAAFRDIQASAL